MRYTDPSGHDVYQDIINWINEHPGEPIPDYLADQAVLEQGAAGEGVVAPPPAPEPPMPIVEANVEVGFWGYIGTGVAIGGVTPSAPVVLTIAGIVAVGYLIYEFFDNLFSTANTGPYEGPPVASGKFTISQPSGQGTLALNTMLSKPGVPSRKDGYEPPKNWNGQKVKNPNGPGYGYPDKNGNVWVPNTHKGTHAPHWDVQKPGGGHTPVYPK